MVTPISIAGRQVGPGHPCLVIAEAGVNHNGRLELAYKLVGAAAKAGAEVVKFQSFVAEEVVTPDAPQAEYQKAHGDPAQSQLEMIRALQLSPDDHRAIVHACRQARILFLSTPFDLPSLRLLLELGVPAIKVPSGEVTNLPFLGEVAKSGKPVILSTGMSNLPEVASAVKTMREAGCRELALLHCVSAYPADPRQVNLRAMATLSNEFGLPVGYSDHTLGLEVPLAAVALGACIIEKHFTLDRNLPGPDHAASATPQEIRDLVAGARVVEAALGHGRKEAAPGEADAMAVARRSLVAAVDIPAGALIQPSMVAIRRPGTGLAPARLPELLGRQTKAAIPAGSLLSLEMLA